MSKSVDYYRKASTAQQVIVAAMFLEIGLVTYQDVKAQKGQKLKSGQAEKKLGAIIGMALIFGFVSLFAPDLAMGLAILAAVSVAATRLGAGGLSNKGRH